MKKVFLVLVCIGGILQASDAQTVKVNKKIKLRSEKFQLQKMSKLHAGLYIRKKREEVCYLDGGRDWNPWVESLEKIIYDFRNYNTPKPTEIFQHHKDYSNEDLMKLPASNTYDIIKILDTDRILTQW